MSITDRLCPPPDVQKVNDSTSDSASVGSGHAIGIVLYCEDMSDTGTTHRKLEYSRDSCRHIDLVRATITRLATESAVSPSNNARAVFSCPVMSRQHARISFEENGQVTIMDLGSMHGTYVEKDNNPPVRLEPRCSFYLRHGDIVLLGKSVIKDNRDWKPVKLRVCFKQSRQDDSVVPNRYGVFNADYCSSECSDSDDDESSIDSESDDAEDEIINLHPSPVTLPKPIEDVQPGPGSFHCKLNVEVIGSDKTVDTTIDCNIGSTSASARLRGLLPAQFPLQLPRFSPMHNLPSLRELGFSASTSSGENGVKNSNGDVTTLTAKNNADVEVITNLPAQESPISASSDSNTSESSTNFSWMEPSLPQNQLGLEHSLNESHGVYSKLPPSSQVVYISDEGEDELNENVENSEHVDEDEGEKSMEISPSPEPLPIPVAQANTHNVFDYNAGSLMSKIHEQEEQPLQTNSSWIPPYVHFSQNAPTRATRPFTRVVDAREGLTARDSCSDDFRRIIGSGSSNIYGHNVPIPPPPPPPPIFFPMLKNHMPSIRADQHHQNGLHFDSPLGTSEGRRELRDNGCSEANLEALRSTVNKLDDRMQELHQIQAQIQTLSSNASSVSSADRKEMDAVREEMRRLSVLVESVLTKVDVPTAQETNENRSSSMQCAENTTEGSELRKKEKEPQREKGEGVSATEEAASAANNSHAASRKRKREMDNDVQNIVRRTLRSNFSEYVDIIDTEGDCEIVSGYDGSKYIVFVGGRPAKRARTESGAGRLVRNVATMAGYTGLGAILTWTILAYAL